MDINNRSAFLSNISSQFQINVNGLNKSIRGSGFNTPFNDLKKIIAANTGNYRVGNLKVVKISTFANEIYLDDDKTIILSNRQDEISMKIIRGNIRTLAKKVIEENDYEGLLIIATFNIVNGIIKGYVVEEIHKISDLESFKEIFACEIKIMKKAIDVDIFNTQRFHLLSDSNGFSHVPYEENREDNNIKMSTSTDSTPSNFSCTSLLSTPTPLKSTEILVNTNSRKRRNLDGTCNLLSKRDQPPTPILNNIVNVNSIVLNVNDIINAIEFGFLSERTDEIEIQAIRNFLGITHFELAIHLMQLSNRYKITGNMTKIKKK